MGSTAIRTARATRRFTRRRLGVVGVPFGKIRFVQGDTNAVPIGRGTYGSRSMQVGGNAPKKPPTPSSTRRSRWRRIRWRWPPATSSFKDGRFGIVGTDRSTALTDVAKAFYRPAHLPPQFEIVGLEAAGSLERAAKLSERLPRSRGGSRS